jgi:hypothetical protein
MTINLIFLYLIQEINIAIPIKFQLKPNKNWLGITEIMSSTNLRSNSFNQNPIKFSL